MFLFCLVFAMFCARLFICALWSPAGKGLTSWPSFVVSSVSLSLSHWYPSQVWYLIVSIPDLCNLITLLTLVYQLDLALRLNFVADDIILIFSKPNVKINDTEIHPRSSSEKAYIFPS